MANPGRSQSAFLDQIAELDLELLNIFRRRPVIDGFWRKAGAAGLIEHPDGGFAIAENDLAADQRAGPRQGVHGGFDKASWHGRGLGFLLFFDLWLFDQLDAEIEDEKTGVHVSEGVAEVLLQVALEVGHRGSFGGPLLEGFFLFRSEFAGAEHALFLSATRGLPSIKMGEGVDG